MMSTFVRSRPLLRGEPQINDMLFSKDEHTIIFNPTNSTGAQTDRFLKSMAERKYDQKFRFTKTFTNEETNDEIYRVVAAPRIDSFFAGHSVNVFAYGATGCGKTYTINSLVAQFVPEIFARIESSDSAGGAVEYEVKVSYYEIYNERIYDLFAAGGMRKRPLRILGTGADTHVKDLSVHAVSSAEQMMTTVARGRENRIQAATGANSSSSRSHAVLEIELVQSCGRVEGAVAGRTSKFKIIDLAGNERNSRTQNRDVRLVESGSINKSLLTLGRCVRAVALGHRPPYRDSALTRVLESSLSGRCETAMIACISPCWKHFGETRNTLMYSEMATSRAITFRPLSVGLSPVQQLIESLQSQVFRLNTELVKKNAELAQKNAEIARMTVVISEQAEKLSESDEHPSVVADAMLVSPRKRTRFSR